LLRSVYLRLTTFCWLWRQGYSAEARPGSVLTTKVLIADDHVLVRQGLREYLDMSADIEVIAEASNGQEVLAIMETTQARPDVALIDVRMPEVDGLEVARSMRKRYPDTQVVMLSAYGGVPRAPPRLRR